VAARSNAFWDRSSYFLIIKSCALVSGLGAAFMVSTDIDPPEAVLRVAPIAYWRTAGLRLLAWLSVGGSVLLSVAPTLNAKPVSAGSIVVLWESFLPDFVLVSAVCFLAATIFGSYVGGGVSFVVIGGLALSGSRLRRFPLGLTEAPPTSNGSVAVWHRWQLGRGAVGLLSLVMIVSALGVLKRAGVTWNRTLRGDREESKSLND